MDTKKELTEFMQKYKFICCYGAGTYGKRFAKYCKKNKLKIDAFLVSDDQESKEKFFLKIPIYILSQIPFSRNDCGVIIALDEKYHSVILDNLKNNNLNHVALLEKVPRFLEEEYLNEIKKRESLSIFKYKELAEDLDLITREKCSYNAFYGHDRIIKKLLGKSVKEILHCTIEHGPGPAGNVIDKYEVDIDNEVGEVFYTSSGNRAMLYRKYLPNKKIESIGLFIQYVESMFEEKKLKKIKKKLGKVLLVFPYHSTHLIKSTYNMQEFIDKIEKVKKKYNTVLICMYWKDILLGFEKSFVKKGYRIVTAGHIYDYNFLRRLRSIISLSDMTMSNEIGSQVGYCVCLGKPHYLYLQEVEHFSENKKMKNTESMGLVSADQLVVSFDRIYQQKVRSEAERRFGKFKEYLTEDDKDFVREHWGEWKEE